MCLWDYLRNYVYMCVCRFVCTYVFFPMHVRIYSYTSNPFLSTCSMYIFYCIYVHIMRILCAFTCAFVHEYGIVCVCVHGYVFFCICMFYCAWWCVSTYRHVAAPIPVYVSACDKCACACGPLIERACDRVLLPEALKWNSGSDKALLLSSGCGDAACQSVGELYEDALSSRTRKP